MQICRDCNVAKDSAEFGVANRRPGGVQIYCRACCAIRYKKHYDANRDKLIARATEVTKIRRLRPEVREKERVWARDEMRKKHTDPVAYAEHLARTRAWYHANPEKVSQFKHRQSHLRAYQSMQRYRRCKVATPLWVDREAIKKKYLEAFLVTKATGIQHEVDHIMPLAGRGLCGLNVPWNLQIITAIETRTKHNKTPAEHLGLAFS